ncbi:MAG: hypothetical protein CMD83_14040 [Gammaproteobacteria bacterium]|nr:hypothetical protein [Gammaproteobacteria bacterium]
MKPLHKPWRRIGEMTGAVALALSLSSPTLAEQELEEVVVTGSYIKRTAQDSPSPLSVISSADIENVHAVDVQELIQRLPYESGGWIRASTFDGGGGQGRIPINLRNLGDCSTLPLVNGRRHVTGWLNPSGCAAVDTNSMLPTLMVGRVEIVKDGSSALYGSDAIAGVVNFITKDDFEGVDLDMRYLVDEATELGDEYSLGFLIGTQSDRGGFVAGGDYLERNEIPTIHPDVFKIQGGFGYSDTGQPGWYQIAGGNTATWAASGNPVTVPGGILPRSPAAEGTDPTTNPDLWGNADLNCLNISAWDGPGASLGLFPAGGTENMRCSIDYGPFFSIQEGELMHKFYSKAHYSLTDNLEVFVEGGFAEQEFYRRNSLAPQTRAPTIPVHNPALIDDAGRRGINPVPLVNRSRLLGGTPRTPEHLRPIHTEQDGDRDTIRLVAGFTWDTYFGDKAWTLNGSFTSSQNSSFQFNVEDSRAAETVFALEGLGGPNCNYAGKDEAWRDANRGSGNQNYAGAGTFEDGDCYYLNPMGSGLFDANNTFRDTWSNPHTIPCPDASQPLCSRVDPTTGLLPTNISLANPPELFNWLDGTWTQNDEYQQDVLDLVFAGDLFEMPAGMASLAVGYQRRHDSMNRQYDINFTQFNAAFRFGASNVRGELTTNAQFVELALPLLETLDLQVAVRREDFKQLNQSTTDPKISVIWRPNDSFSGRLSWGQSFRVGSILQLVGPQTIVSNTDDPFADTSFFIPWISEGQPNLQPEISEAFNIGISWAPVEGMFEGFTVNADYWTYTYEDLITKQSAPAILFEDGCARANARAAGGGLAAPSRCDRSSWFSGSATAQVQSQVVRNANGAPVRILPDFINANEAEAAGLDFDIGYTWNTESFGTFNFQAMAAWYLTYDVEAGGVNYDGIGSMNNVTPIARPLPEWKVNYNINWTMDRHSVFWQTRFVSDVEWDSGWSSARRLRVLAATGRDIGTYAAGEHELGGSTYSDVYYTYQLPWGATESSITVGFRNVFDEGVDVANNANGYSAIMQDARGRMWMVRYRMGF